MRRSRGLGLLALTAALGGCARPGPVQPPVLTLARMDCETAPNFAGALPVRTQDRLGTVAVLEQGLPGQGGKCLAQPGSAATTYAVFALPTEAAPYTLEILSGIVGNTIVRPVATLHDAAGQVVRTIPPEEFEQGIYGLRAGVRPRGTERWVVVTADAARLGQTFNVQLGGMDGRVQTAAVVYIPIIIVPPTIPDVVRQRSAVIALNGRITVVAAPARLAN